VTSVKVKNTFIDGFDGDDEEEEEMPLMTKAKSCPGKAVSPSTSAGTPVHQAQSMPDADHMSPGSSPRATRRPATMPAVVQAAESGRRISSYPSSGSDEDPMGAAEIEPLQSRQPCRSRGALLHDRGQCRPCAWYWKAQGCHLGEECCHCHMCPKGELKARKKIKLVAIRARDVPN
jgi:hypothetical protein